MSKESDYTIASRSIAFSEKNGSHKGVLEVEIMQPRLLDDERFSSNGWLGLFGCKVVFDVFPHLNYEVKGADALHALQLAVSVDPVLRSLTQKYDLFFLDGNPYFEV